MSRDDIITALTSCQVNKLVIYVTDSTIFTSRDTIIGADTIRQCTSRYDVTYVIYVM